ncbi:MAG: glycosyltransferase family 9 protein [Hyphomonas sp.]|uniref:glycosyltransferase family 9 protein n=1 Tax=Hyphomonas sp. TaxID=87 RepID=UPI0035275F52
MAKPAKLASPVNPGASAKEVLVIKLSALGDFVLALGAMKAVREFHPSARITLLTTPPFEDFASHCPYFDRVETDGRPATMKATTALLSRLRKANYDIVYDFQTSGRTKNYFTALSKTGKGPLWSGHHEKAAFFHDNPDRGTMHSIDRLAEQLAVAGVAPDGRWNVVNFPKPDLSWVRPKLRNAPRLQPAYFGLEEPYMLLIPGASEHREAKRWPVENYAELARRIADAGATPAIIGSKAEGQLALEIMKREKRVKSLVTRTDLFQIVTLAEKAAFVVGNDTGPMHMAAIAGAPGVALFATNESNPDHAAPRGPSPVIINSAPTLAELEVDTVWRSVLALGVLPA